MGAWGHGHFEDDSAWDFMDEIEEADDPKEVINTALDAAIETEYLESDDGNAVIVAATYVDRQQNGTIFSSPDRDEPLSVDTFPDRHPDVDFADLKNKAIQALQRLLGDDSELNELWAENEELYPAWKQGIEALILRLSK